MNKSYETGPYRIMLDDWVSCAPFENYLGMDIVETAEGRAVLTMPFVLNLAQGAGLMHGGALVSLADTAVVMAIKSLLEPSTHFVTLSLQSRFLAPVSKGTVTAEARVVSQQDKTLIGEAVLYNDERKEVMRFDSVFKVIHRS